jgi:hypothetical protein
MKKMKRKTNHLNRVSPPPNPHLSSQTLPANRVLSVLLRPGEEVQWIWSVNPRGVSYVSGYEILNKSGLT